MTIPWTQVSSMNSDEIHENLAAHGANQSATDSSSTRMRSAVQVLELLEEWKSAGGTEPNTVAYPPAESIERNSADGGKRTLGRFRIDETIGRGGYGIVVRAHDPKLGRNVAVKIPRLDTSLSGESTARFIREAEVAAGLSHPGIVYRSRNR